MWSVRRSLIKDEIDVYAKPPYTRWRVLLCCMWFPVVGWAYCCVKCMIPELLICPRCDFEFGKKTRTGKIQWTNKPAPPRSESPLFWRPRCPDLNHSINRDRNFKARTIFLDFQNAGRQDATRESITGDDSLTEYCVLIYQSIYTDIYYWAWTHFLLNRYCSLTVLFW